MPKSDAKNSWLSIRLSPELFARLSEVAEQEDRTASAVARRAIEAYLKDVEDKNAG